MQGFHAEKLLHHVFAHTFHSELQAAVDYATQVAHSAEWVECLGKSAAATKPTDVLAKMTGPLGSDSVTFGGTLSLLATVLTARKELASWRPDTCQTYLGVADKIDANGVNIVSKWEFQRGALVDGITILRSAATAAANPEEMSVLLETLFFETCGRHCEEQGPQGLRDEKSCGGREVTRPGP